MPGRACVAPWCLGVLVVCPVTGDRAIATGPGTDAGAKSECGLLTRATDHPQQVRAVCGLPLGDMTPLAPAAMANLLGDL